MARLKEVMGGRAIVGAAAAMMAAAGLTQAAAAQTVPNAVVLESTVLVPTINGSAGHVGANTAGDAFYVSQGDNTAYWLPRGATTPIALVTGLSGARNAYVDQATNNVYIPSNYSGAIVEVPYVNGTYATGSAFGSLTACSSVTVTAPCKQFGNGGSALSYYYQPNDVGFDANHNAYMSDYWSNTYPGGSNQVNSIVEWTPSGSTYTATVIATGMLPHTQSSQIAVDKAGDIYYADGTNLYYVSAATAAAVVSKSKNPTLPTAISGFTAPSGVAVDQYGDLFVTDSTKNTITEFPAVNGSVPITITGTNPSTGTFANGFVFDPTYSANGVAFDGLGDMFYTGYANSATNLNEASINYAALGSAAVGTSVSASSTTLTVVFTNSATVAAVGLSGGSATAGFTYTAGTCAAGAYTAGQTCTVNVNYTPTAVGLQRGAVVLTNASGGVIGQSALSGIGLGPVETNDPGTVSALGSGYGSPTAVAVDSSGNVFVADAGKNAVYEYVGGTGTAVSIGSGLSKPSGVAVDNAGNVYIADAGNGRVVEVPSVAGVLTTSAQSVVMSGLGSMIGLATDGHGNLYVADTNNNAVYQLASVDGTPSTSQQTTVSVPNSKAPYALATDSVGDLFVADLTANTVTEVAFYGKAITNIGAGFSSPSGLATDASNSLYVADPGNYRLIKIPYENPIYNANDQYVVGPPFSTTTGLPVPYAVAVNPTGNLYVVDNKDATVSFVNRVNGTLNLGTTNVNTTTTQQNAYIGNAGNQTLKFANPQYSTTANPAFTITSPSTGGCTGGQTLAASFACILQVTFTPPAAQSYSQVLSFASNAVNSATPSLTLTGTGANLAATTLSLQQISPKGTAAYGQTVTVQATVSSKTAGTPGGYIEFYVDGQFYTVVPVSSGGATISLNGLLGGTHTIAANYTGDNTFASSNTTLSITVVKAGSTVTIAGSGGNTFYNPLSATPGAAVTLTATIVPNASTPPTGTVTFTVGGLVLGTGSVVPSGTSYIAQITTTALPLGTDQVVATYNGDVNYATSVGTVAIIISNQTFTLTPASQTITVSQAGTATAQLQVLSLSGFSASGVGLTCSGLPANTECGFNPNGFVIQASNQLTAQQCEVGTGVNGVPCVLSVAATYGPINITMYVITGNTPPVNPPGVGQLGALHMPGLRGPIPVTLALLGLAPLGLVFRRSSRRKVRNAARLLVVIALLGVSVSSFTGCGSNLVGNTPKGTYNVTVTATAGTTAQSVQVTLVVQ